jgi:DNA-binding transcriptional regulator YiaG
MTIKEICEKYNISQTELARRFGIPLRTVQGWYLGERKPPVYVPGMIVELLELARK